MTPHQNASFEARRIVEQLASGVLTEAGALVQIVAARHRYGEGFFDNLLEEAQQEFDEQRAAPKPGGGYENGGATNTAPDAEKPPGQAASDHSNGADEYKDCTPSGAANERISDTEEAAQQPAVGPDKDQALAFLRAIWGPHVGSGSHVGLVALNGMAAPPPSIKSGRRDTYKGRRTKHFTIRLCDYFTFESDLIRAVDQCAALQEFPGEGNIWNIYWTPIVAPDGADRKGAIEAGGFPLGLHLDADCVEREATIAGFSSATGVPRPALHVINTGSVPNDRFQVFAPCAPMPSQLDREKVLATSLGCDPNVYVSSQLLRAVGFVAQPWKGGKLKDGRVPELVTWTPPTAKYSGSVNLPPSAEKAKKKQPKRAKRVLPKRERPEATGSEKSGNWTQVQQDAFDSYVDAQKTIVADLEDDKRFKARCAIMRKLALIVDEGLGSEESVYDVARICDDPENTDQPGRYEMEAEAIINDPFDEAGTVSSDAVERAQAAAEEVIAAIRAGAANAKEIERHRQAAFHRSPDIDWNAKMDEAKAHGVNFDEFAEDTPGAAEPGGSTASGGTGAGADSGQTFDDFLKEQAANLKARPVITAYLKSKAEDLTEPRKTSAKYKSQRVKLLRRIGTYEQLGVITTTDISDILRADLFSRSGASEAECKSSEHDLGIGRVVITLIAAREMGFEAAEKEAERLARACANGGVSEHHISFGAFTMGPKGLTAEVQKGSGDNAETIVVPVSAGFEILGSSRDSQGEQWGLWLRWKDGDGREHMRLISSEQIHGDPKLLCALLGGSGLQINAKFQSLFKEYLGGVRDLAGRVTLAAHTGWLQLADGGRAFVMPHETIKPDGAEEIVLDGGARANYSSMGSLDDWKAGVGSLVKDHILGVFAVSVALTGPLLGIVEHDGSGVHCHGASSIGKTTLEACAASVWGKGATASGGFIMTWRATANGLEGAAAATTDTLLCLDEFGQLISSEAQAAIYMLGNGAGKARAARDGSLRDPKTWRVMIFSTGEAKIEDKIAEDRGRKAKAGQLVRLLNIPADRGLGFGAFDKGDEGKSAAAMSVEWKKAAVTYYGTAGPEFVRQLIAKEIDGPKVQAMVNAFIDSRMLPWWDGQVLRAAGAFGLIAAAGELATEWGITGWDKERATNAAAWALTAWIEQRGGSGASEETLAVEQVRSLIEKYGDSRFDDLVIKVPACDDTYMDGSKPALVRLGWREGDGDAREWYILPETWKTEFCVGMDPQLVARTLSAKGMLRADKGHLTSLVRLGKHGRRRCYIITAKIFLGD